MAGNTVHFGSGVFANLTSSSGGTVIAFSVPNVAPNAYVVYVTNINGQSNGKTFTVTATPQRPTCTLTASATSVPLGNTVNLKWTSTNSPGGTITDLGSVGPSGIQGVIPKGNGVTYVGTFAGASGTTPATCSVRVTVQSGSGTIGGSGYTPTVYDPGTNTYIPATYNPTTNTYTPQTYAPPTSGYTPTIYNPATNTYTPATYNPTTNTYTPTTNTTTNPPNSTPQPTPQGGYSSGLVSCGATPPGDAYLWFMDATECGLCNFGQLIQNIINYMLALAIPISVALFAYVGILYFGSAANPAGIEKAKGIFKTTFIGLAVAISAYLIVQVLLSALLDQSFLNLNNWKTLQCASNEDRPRSATVADIFAKWTTTTPPGGVAVGGTPGTFTGDINSAIPLICNLESQCGKNVGNNNGCNNAPVPACGPMQIQAPTACSTNPNFSTGCNADGTVKNQAQVAADLQNVQNSQTLAAQILTKNQNSPQCGGSLDCAIALYAQGASALVPSACCSSGQAYQCAYDCGAAASGSYQCDKNPVPACVPTKGSAYTYIQVIHANAKK